MAAESLSTEIVAVLTAAWVIGEKAYKLLIRGDVFARKSDIPTLPEGMITTANIHDEVSKILVDKKVMTLDQCQQSHKEQEDKFYSIINKKLDSLCVTNKTILRFLAKQCKTPEEFTDLMNLNGDIK